MPSLDTIRSHFPALAGDTVFMENAGGSQVPAVVADRIREYMLSTYVQLDAPYDTSRRSTETVARAHAFVNLLMNGTNSGSAILGPSCTQLTAMLARCHEPLLAPGDAIVVAETAHEANVGPWVRLADRGIEVRMWPVDRDHPGLRHEDLAPLLDGSVRLVAFPHVSNLLGEIVDVAAVTEMVHAAGARVVVDGVAYAPHRAIDVAAWNVDWYVYSTYKVYGPHMAALYGRDDAVGELAGPNHFFIPRDEVPYKFELGGACHEGCAGLLALGEYLNVLAGRPEASTIERETVVEAFEVMTACELPLQQRLIDHLAAHPRVRIIGPAHGEASRVSTISFVHESRPSAEIAADVCRRGIGIRSGHMYAYRLCEALGLEVADGVVRVSLVHYNTSDEVARLIDALDEVL